MKMRSQGSSWRAVAPLVLVMVVLAGGAPVMLHRSDNFNNNSLAAYWGVNEWGNADLAEVDQRLEFRSTGPTGATSYAGMLYEPHGINWRKDFHIEFNYKLSVNTILAPRELFIGVALPVEGQFPQSMTGLACGVLRDVGGLWACVLRYQNGNIIDFQGTQITQKTGTIEIDWDFSMDRMTVDRSGTGGSAHLDGYYGDEGGLYGTEPMGMVLGCVTYNGNVNFSGNNVYIDNWEADYFRRPF